MTSAPGERTVGIAVAGVSLWGDLAVPAMPRGLVVFAHGSGSSRLSPRNRFVARTLQEHGIATLLVDLLTAAEETIDARTAHLRFDIPLLAARLGGVTDRLAYDAALGTLPIGYFGASTGAAAALTAAAERPDMIRAVVCRGGRPDLAGESLTRVRAPTLFIVGGNDIPVIALNRRARSVLRAESRINIVPNAGHLFEEPGALERAASLATGWFDRYLIRAGGRRASGGGTT